MLDDEAYVRNWLVKNGYLEQKEIPFEYRYSYKEEKIREKNRFFRKVENYKHDTSRKFSYGLNNTWKSIAV